MTPGEGRAVRVLLATDGSDDAKAAGTWVRHLPLPADREMMVLTVVSPPRIAVGVNELDELHTALVAEARHLADETAARMMTRHAIGRVVEGDARDEIVAAARSWGADLVVLGARGLGVIARVVLGSVSMGVVRHAPCPVLVCRGAPREIRTITVGLDGSGHARRALQWLLAWPWTPAVTIRLLSIVEPDRHPSVTPGLLAPSVRAGMAALETERRAALDAELAQAAAMAKARVGEVQTVVGRGTSAVELVDDAERHGADLIVVGARGLGAMRRLLLGSVSESVLSHAACPVLVVRSASVED